MKNVFIFMFTCLGSLLSAQQFETGVVIDSLPVANNLNETFALYLPKVYDPNKGLPILFVFSPSGNGKKGIEVFVKAAETYNHIIVCSNNSRNGPMGQNFEITQRLFTHIFSDFNILQNRIYLAGFSGGSRLATAIATLSDKIEGVIACGAGFSSSPSHIPSKQSFSYVGICGDRDMNYSEMIKVNRYLNRIQFTNTLFTFDGNHEWPPNDQILMAFEWLETKAHKKGYLKKPSDELMTNYLKTLGQAKNYIENDRPLIAVEYYERAVNTYGSFFNLDSILHNIKNIKKKKSYTNTLKSRKKAFEKEEVLSSLYLTRFKKDYLDPEKVNLKWWEKEVEKLNKQESKSDVQMTKMLERLRFKVFVMAFQETRLNSEANKKQRDFGKFIVSLFYTQKS